MKVWMEFPDGVQQEIEVAQLEFVVTCPYCKVPFRTIDPDQKYCKQSHRTRAYEHRVKPCVTVA